MQTQSIQEINLQAIADAIKEKLGTTDKIYANEFVEKILSIKTGGTGGGSGGLVIKDFNQNVYLEEVKPIKVLEGYS